MLLLILAGCPKRRVEPPPLETVDHGAPTEVRVAVDGPITWIMDREPGLCLPIPSGWSGTTGPAPLVLEIADDAGRRVELSVSALPFPSQREGYELLFEDDGSYRTVPLLIGGGTRSWQSVDPYGPLVQAWYGQVGGQEVEVAVTTPLDSATASYDLLHALVAGLCTTGR
ncbi:MAG: hypothetical protein H6735_11535 [Alphaproteobacteria bacterium]|nr:hypothetical protein [Alphaproteobacteria bacterium]